MMTLISTKDKLTATAKFEILESRREIPRRRTTNIPGNVSKPRSQIAALTNDNVDKSVHAAIGVT